MTTREHSVEYKEYLNSREWKVRRMRAILLANNRCQRCGACGMQNQLEVHHETYERLGHELDRDLRALCKPCHTIEDEVRRAWVQEQQEEAYFDARLQGWASKRLGSDWERYNDYDRVRDQFERWLEEIGDAD